MRQYIPYKWKLPKEFETQKVLELAKKFSVHPTIIKILFNRGYDNEDKIKKFIYNDIIYLQNPFLFKDMTKAVEIVKKHIEEKNKILIWGDRDVDGISSVALMVRTLKKLGADVIWYIPQTEGYGLHKHVLEKFVNNENIKLVITVDCGITAEDEIKFLIDNNTDVVVTDHHEPNLQTVENIKSFGVPIINPYLPDYLGFKDLAGVGVVLKFVCALIMSYNTKYYNKTFVVLDIETTGLSPIVDEICELAAIKIVNFVQQDVFYTLVKPKKGIPEEVIKIHGITNEMVKNAPSIEEVLPRFLDFIKNATLVVHNADFDIPFINVQLNKLGLPTIDTSNIIDTLKISRQYFPLNSHSLSALATDLTFTTKPQHRAVEDATATSELFYYLYFISNPNLRVFLEESIIFAAFGTISDLVPLVEDNRIIVKKGINNLFSSRIPPFEILTQYVKNALYKSDSDTEAISWNIIPLLNSAGRMQKVETAVNFLLSTNISQAREEFEKLIEINKQRKILQNLNITIFYNLVEEQCNLIEDIILLVVAENIEHGVTGIAANYIMKEFNRPVILLILENDTAIGTVRSPKGINIFQLLKKCEHLFEKFGGHENACGITIKKQNIPIFKQQLKNLEKEIIIEPPTVEIDAELSAEDFGFDLYRYFILIEPCGPENPYPVFITKNVKVVDWKYIGKDNKYAFIIFETTHKKQIPSICWDIPQVGDILRNFSYFNIVGEIEPDPQNKDQLRFVILDLQPVI